MTEPSPNENIQLNLRAISTICSYPLAALRKDMSSSEWLDYKDNWETFNRIWVYNYSVSTINATILNAKDRKEPWMYTSTREKTMYLRGQSGHTDVYPEDAKRGQFNNIPN